MPVYEYYCPDNNKIYSFFARSFSMSEQVPRCPDNPEFRMVKQMSRFAVTGVAKEPSESGPPDLGSDLDERKMEAVMREMESEMAGVDEDNPDPRQLGHMMRRLSEASGEAMPAAMQEMISRLEAGEDPDKLDEEYGDLLDAEEPEAESGEQGGTVRRKKREPQRDPTLYELNDYL